MKTTLNKTTNKRRYYATLILPINTTNSNNEFIDKLKLDFKNSLKIKDRKIKSELKKVRRKIDNETFIVKDFNIKKLALNIDKLENFFKKEFINLIKLNNIDSDVEFIEIIPDSVSLINFYVDLDYIKLNYEFDIRIRLETDLIDLLKKHVAIDTENIFVMQAIPSNKIDLTKQVIKLAKSIHKDWSLNTRKYSNEQAIFAIDLLNSINPYDEEKINNLCLSLSTMDYLNNVYGKNYYIDDLFNLALNEIGYNMKIPNLNSLIEKADLLINSDDHLNDLKNEFIKIYPIDKQFKSKRIDLDELISIGFQSNLAKIKFAKYLLDC